MANYTRKHKQKNKKYNKKKTRGGWGIFKSEPKPVVIPPNTPVVPLNLKYKLDKELQTLEDMEKNLIDANDKFITSYDRTLTKNETRNMIESSKKKTQLHLDLKKRFEEFLEEIEQLKKFFNDQSTMTRMNTLKAFIDSNIK